MKHIRTAVLAWLISVSLFHGLAADNQQAARATYAQLAAKLRAGDSAVDWKALRIAAAIGEVSQPGDFQAIQQGYSALQDGKFADALKIGQTVEEHNIADVDARYLTWRSLAELGRQEEAEKDRQLLAALLDSIQQSGDGKSEKTAWFATTIRETYVFMQAILNVQFQDHRTAQQDGHYYDVVMVKDKDGKSEVLWFNADIEMQRQTAAGEQALEKQAPEHPPATQP